MNFWISLGLFAQFLFFMRFFVQWIASEKKGESTIPISFWYFSIAGSILCFRKRILQRKLNRYNLENSG